MKKIKSYTGIWDVEKVVYSINDWKLPRPITFTQILWGIAFFILSLMMDGIPPFIFKNSMVMNNIAIPFFLAWFVSKKTFDDKRPYSFLLAWFKYLVKRKTNVRGKTKQLRFVNTNTTHITVGNVKKVSL